MCPFDDVPLDFNEMQEYGFVSMGVVEGSIQCNNMEFGEVAPGF
jgi:hypothetical protein